jgi:hypothetical protein
MNKTQLQFQLAELREQVDGFFSVKTEVQGRKALKEHCDQVLAHLPEMIEVLSIYPTIGAMAFLGKFEFSKCPEVDVLAEKTSGEILETIRAGKKVKVEQGASLTWIWLRDEDPEIACKVLAICFLASREEEISKRIER